ncbi:ATP-binding cassette domain-containing protein [Actinomadura sp. SCN-SB]|uniref:ABC transporter permease subunit n=1 Tax=Actinomadura sp. SCN-SB TaxID=3373092 RepID=UPI0037523209
MTELLPFVVIGVVAGSVYGLAATGLVLTYKTAGIFNFAHGAAATTAAYVFYTLHISLELPWPLAAVISVLVLGPVMGFGLEQVARRLAGGPVAYKIVATVGLVLAVQGAFTAIYGAQSRPFPAYLPAGEAFRVAGAVVSWDQVIVAITAAAATVVLYLFFRFTRIGLAMRGVVDNGELLDTSGTDPRTVRRWSWVIGSTFACLAGVLLAPSLSLDALLLTLLVVQAFGAAALGYFASLPLTYLGGLVIGVAASIATKYGAVTDPNALLSGLPPSVPFLALFVVLVVIPRRLPADRRTAPRASAGDRWRAPARVQVGGAVLLAAALLLVPVLVGGARLPFYIDALTKLVLFLSLGLLVRTSGQVSLAHAGFAAIGAAAMAHLAGGLGLPWLVALVLAGLVAVPVGAFIAIPAIRLSGVFLALATFGFGVALEQMGYPLSIMFGSDPNGRTVPRPGWGPFDGDRGYYYLVLAFVVLATLAVVLVHRSRLGRLLNGLGDSPTALATHGANVNTLRVLVFAISAFMAAISGVLYGGSVSAVTGSSFTSFSSLLLLAVLALSLGKEPWYAFTAAAAMVLPGAYISGDKVDDWLNALFGVAAVAISLTGRPMPFHPLRRLADRIGGRAPVTTAPEPVAAEAAGVAAPTPTRVTEREVPQPAPKAGLRVEDLTVRYGGHVAVDGFSLAAPMGRITGLIGPNGAGKTTTFDVCCGLLHPAEGRVFLHGRDVSRLGPASRARRGLGRTFQRMELFDSMTVRDNLVLGREASLAGALPWRHLLDRRRDRAVIDDAVAAAVADCGLEPLLDLPAGVLSTGQRRLVELARCLAGPFDMLLLDEPSSGLNRAETARLGEVLERVVADRGLGVLLIEHDMALVMDICEYIHVLDFGTEIFRGTAAEVASSEIVRAAYLGSESVLEAPTAKGAADPVTEEVTG